MAGKTGVRMLIHSLLLSTVIATPLNYLFKRASTCSSIHAKSDNGNRKVAIVVDSSGSMVDSDPANLRLSAGVELTNWLISNKEATASIKPDLVTVINFADTPTLDYALGDPGNADSAFNGIGADGGTFIAGGVQMAIAQIVGGPAPTAQRSGIVVFTDGEVSRERLRDQSCLTFPQDSDVSVLVDAINNANFPRHSTFESPLATLDVDGSQQDPTVLQAIGKSGGQYLTTMYNDGSANDFINLVIQNGITYNDNPTGTNSTLLSGMQTFRFVTGSQTMSIQYIARRQRAHHLRRPKLQHDWSRRRGRPRRQPQGLEHGPAGRPQQPAGQRAASTWPPRTPGLITIKLSVAEARSKDAMVLIAANSNLPAQNCTISVGSDTLGISTSPIPPHCIQTAMAVALPPLAGLIGIIGFFVAKYMGAGAAAGAGGAAAGGVGGGAAGAAGAAARGPGPPPPGVPRPAATAGYGRGAGAPGSARARLRGRGTAYGAGEGAAPPGQVR